MSRFYREKSVGLDLVVFSVFVEELFAEGVFDGGGVVGFAEDAEVGLVGAEGEGCAGVGADTVGAAHCGRCVRESGVVRLEWWAGGIGTRRQELAVARQRVAVAVAPLQYTFSPPNS